MIRTPSGPQGAAPDPAPEGNKAARIAREALQRMVTDRVAPTPENFRIYYHRIQGTRDSEAFPGRNLRLLARLLPRHTPEQLRLAQQFDAAVESERWPDLQRAMAEVARALSSPADALPWGALLLSLLDTVTKRGREAQFQTLRTTLSNGRAPAESLYQVLTHLQAEWAWEPESTTRADLTDPHELKSSLGSLLEQLFAQAIPGVLMDNPCLADESRVLASLFANGADALSVAPHQLQSFLQRLEGEGEEAHSVRHALVRVLQLVISNISELVLDDRWLHGQLSVLQEAFSRPLDIRTLDEIERRLTEVIEKQRHLKRQLTDAQERLKHMLAGFVDRLASFSDATGSYHELLEHCALQISGAESLEALSAVVEEMLKETRAQQSSAKQSHQELAELRVLVDSANQQILQLQRELDETSELVRHDPLTGVLNRKGLDETLEREILRARRSNHPLCVGLIDVDDFKQINDTLGHQAGDLALQHLVQVVRDGLRAHDYVGRLGGEEFLLILPDTPLDEAVMVLTRLQRELTKRYFLADDRRLLITFSAGVAELAGGEAASVAVARADHAMYLAKRAGKNRVFAA